MNTGVVSARYAKALLLLVQETGNGERVFEQVRTVLERPAETPARLEPELEKLVLLLRANSRMDLLKFVLRDFVRAYCVQNGICLARRFAFGRAGGPPAQDTFAVRQDPGHYGRVGGSFPHRGIRPRPRRL